MRKEIFPRLYNARYEIMLPDEGNVRQMPGIQSSVFDAMLQALNISL